MLTGQHVIRDVMCSVCNTKIGWFYEMAKEKAQKYKEGCTVIEVEYLREEEEED